MKKSTLPPYCPVLAAGAALAGLVAWSRLRAPVVPVTVIVGLDTSRSVRRPLPGGGYLLGRSRASVADLADRLEPGADHLVVARVDRATHEFFDDSAPEDAESFLQTLLVQTEEPPDVDGTRPAAFWQLAARRAASVRQAPGSGVAIEFLGDGDNDDLTPAARDEIRLAARALAANRRVVAVEFFGADPKNWGVLRELFAPLGARLHLHPPQDMAPDGLLNRLDDARGLATSKAA